MVGGLFVRVAIGFMFAGVVSIKEVFEAPRKNRGGAFNKTKRPAPPGVRNRITDFARGRNIQTNGGK